MVATARGWLPADDSWPGPVDAGVAAGRSVDQSPTVAWLQEPGEGPSRVRAWPLRDARPPEIRKRVADALAALRALVEPALTAAVRRARQAWDQADALVVLDERSLAEIATLRRWLATCAASGRTEAAASALEGLLVLDAALALTRLFERRLAALLRLRLRSAEPELLPGGRPFLDLAAALREAEQAWR